MTKRENGTSYTKSDLVVFQVDHLEMVRMVILCGLVSLMSLTSFSKAIFLFVLRPTKLLLTLVVQDLIEGATEFELAIDFWRMVRYLCMTIDG